MRAHSQTILEITLVFSSTTAKTALPSQPPITATIIPSVKSVKPWRYRIQIKFKLEIAHLSSGCTG